MCVKKMLSLGMENSKNKDMKSVSTNTEHVKDNIGKTMEMCETTEDLIVLLNKYHEIINHIRDTSKLITNDMVFGKEIRKYLNI